MKHRRRPDYFKIILVVVWILILGSYYVWRSEQAHRCERSGGVYVKKWSVGYTCTTRLPRRRY